VLVAVTGLLVAAAGGLWWAGSLRDDSYHALPAAGSEAPRAGTTPRPVPAAWVPGAPRRMRIPALGVNVPVVPVHAPGGTLVPPSDPQELGWWADGAEPGAKRGSALVAGHTVHDGGGALDHLGTLAPGSGIVVTTARGTIRYRVTQVRDYRKGTLADDAPRLFSQRVAGRLVVVTCTDWNGVTYLSNTVVTAVPVG
jgi:LPXTG-site transpeptidase (sortase) family protein